MSKIMNEGYKMEVEKSCWQSLKTKLFWFNLTLLTKIAYVNTTAGFPPPPPPPFKGDSPALIFNF